MTNSYTAADQDGAQALDYNQHSARWQYSVQSGCDVTINSGTLGASDTLSIASGSVFFNGNSTSVSSQNAQIDNSNSDPRKDVVYLDTNGSVNVSKGTAEPKDPSGNLRFETFRPAPNDLTGTDAVVLATVFVPGAATSIQSADIRDRRLFADISTQSITTEEINNIVYATDGDNIKSLIENLSPGDELVQLPGAHHIVSSSIAPPDNVTLTILGTLEMEDGVEQTLLERTNGPSGITIRGGGPSGNKGLLKANRTSVSGDTNTMIINFAGGPSHITVRDIRCEEAHDEAALRFAQSDSTVEPGVGLTIENVAVLNAGTSGQTCDGIFARVEDATIRNVKTQNVTDTHIVIDSAVGAKVDDCRCTNTSTFNSNNQQANNGITLWPNKGEAHLVVSATEVAKTGGDHGVGVDGNEGNPAKLIVEGGTEITGTHTKGINLPADTDQESSVSDVFIRGTSGNGIFCAVDGPDIGAGVRIQSPGGTGIRAEGAFKIRGVTVDSPSTNAVDAAAAVAIHDCTFVSPGDHGVVVRASDTEIYDTEINSANLNGVEILDNVTDLIVKGCQMDGDGDKSGIQLGSGTVDSVFNSNNIQNFANGIDRSASNTDSNAYVGNMLAGNTTAINGSAGADSQTSANVTA